MNHPPSVFLDPSGRRATLAKRAVLVGGAVVSALISAFVVSLAASTAIRPQKLVHYEDTMSQAQAQNRAQKVLKDLKVPSRAGHAVAPLKPTDDSGHITLAFYAPWEETGRDSFTEHASALTHVAPVWLKLSPDAGSLDTRDYDLASNPNNQQVIDTARANGVKIIPVLTNSSEDEFDPAIVHKLLASQDAQTAIIQQTKEFCHANGYQGINLDLEEIPDADLASVGPFLDRFYASFKQAGLELSMDVQTGLKPEVLAGWSDSVDYLVLMDYDQHEEGSDAGPIAGIEWSEEQLDNSLAGIPSSKLVLGIGAYGYDWTAGGKKADSVTFQEAMALAAGYRDQEAPAAVIQWDEDSFNSWFTYDDDNDKKHTVWMLDAMSAYNQMLMAKERNLRGLGLWALGSGDPALWKFYNKSKLYAPFDVNQLDVVAFGREIDFTGKGEILSVLSRPSNGKRTVEFDPDSGYIVNAEYQSYASGYLLQQSGFKPKSLVLTFDDGPDPNWTPKILAVLRKYNVPAAFFCVGVNVESNPELVREEYTEGNEVGNHSFTHPNLGTVGNQRASLEINATQRVIESTVGRGTRLFRPPYNADSEPNTEADVMPISLADSLGLITVGESIDPQDWNPIYGDDTNSPPRPRTVDDIVNEVINQVTQRQGTSEEGNVILLHDAGGDRSQTVAALDRMIPALQARGYKFVTCAGLLNQTRDQVMPPIPASDAQLIRTDRVMFTSLHWLQMILATAFTAAIILGAARVISLLPLAVLHRNKRKKQVFDPNFHPSVSVVIAGYNEEKTVEATVRSVLKTEYELKEVIVVNDGSTDKTAEVLQKAFKDEPWVVLVNQANGGKASALRNGLSVAKGELALCIDADTQLDPQAVGYMVRHFSDPKIAAVAGNVRVGNVNNLLTAWQDVEYRTSQNMDRRAYAYIDAVTVVPGAIGLWRRSALDEVGGLTSDTLAEDMDLTWRLHLAGYHVETESEAIAWTEAPEKWGALVKQRFRWAYGTLQCLYKHKGAMGRNGWFGWFALPSLWLFQIVFQILGPIVDLQLLWSIFVLAFSVFSGGDKEFSAAHQFDSLSLMLELYAMFFCLEFVSGLIAYRMDRTKPWSLGWLLIQRFAYRQLMYVVMLKSLWRALVGVRTGWGNLKRTGSVKAA